MFFGYAPLMRLSAGYRARSARYLTVTAVLAAAGVLIVLATATGSELAFAVPFAIVGILSMFALAQSRARNRRHGSSPSNRAT